MDVPSLILKLCITLLCFETHLFSKTIFRAVKMVKVIVFFNVE